MKLSGYNFGVLSYVHVKKIQMGSAVFFLTPQKGGFQLLWNSYLSFRARMFKFSEFVPLIMAKNW